MAFLSGKTTEAGLREALAPKGISLSEAQHLKDFRDAEPVRLDFRAARRRTDRYRVVAAQILLGRDRTIGALANQFDRLNESVLVLRVPLSLAERVMAVAERLLTKTDLDRAERFVQQADRDRHLLAWGVVRLVLASALDESPRSLDFTDNGYGKKHIGRPDCGLRFNLSHSGDYVLFALADGVEVGIDIERMRPLPDLMAVAERIFSPAERIVLNSLPVDCRTAAFYAIWTRKEAFIKVVGMGLRLPLDDFDVCADPAAEGRLLAVRYPGYRVESWSLSDVEVGPGYRAALALEGPGAPAHRDLDLTDALFQALLRDLS